VESALFTKSAGEMFTIEVFLEPGRLLNNLNSRSASS
jgi:hypothetical protein